ncbi:MAG: ATP-binding cassette domain-containing protein [Chthoniobacteraceae bacterium]
MTSTPLTGEPAFGDPRCDDFLQLNHFPSRQAEPSVQAYWEALPWETREQSGWSYEQLRDGLGAFLASADATPREQALSELKILPGRDKSGREEKHTLCFRAGDVICIVGPTGSGKSRLLADIECMAQGDTPTGRTVLIDGCAPDPDARFSGEGKIVAQISQNMNFVMDLTVVDFLRMHAESRALDHPEEAITRVLEAAVGMAGEPFGPGTPLTQLSGGQSRALMIADAAHLSPKPVVLIDEIENAGVDRLRALDLFVEKGKIVLLSTHDPLLALSGTRRLVIGNGAVQNVIEPSREERDNCRRLVELDRCLARMRERLRHGERLDEPWERMMS